MKRQKYAIIMAAGSGTRMGAELPKQFIELDGKPLLRMTMEKFICAGRDIKQIVVLPKPYMEYWREYCLKSGFSCPQILVSGGITRFHSVKNALQRVPDGAVVAIHDGVRPLVSVEMIEAMFSKAETVPALIPVVPCVDTMRALEDAGGSLEPVSGVFADRSRLYGVQTPQVFHSELLKEAYSQGYDVSFTDDASVVEKYGKSLSFIKGERLNIKITTPEDLALARAILSL